MTITIGNFRTNEFFFTTNQSQKYKSEDWTVRIEKNNSIEEIRDLLQAVGCTEIPNPDPTLQPKEN